MSLKRVLVLLLAIGQILTSAFGGFMGQGVFSEPLITPAGYAFSIWGVITLGCLVYGIYQILPLVRVRKNKLYDQLAWPLVVVFTGFSIWIIAAARSWLVVTLIVFLCMLLGLWRAYEFVLLSKQRLSALERVLIEGTLGLYLGWSSVAIVLNVMSVLYFYGFLYADERSLIAYVAILWAAMVMGLYALCRSKYNLYLLGTLVWAFVAVAVRTSERGSLLLLAVSLLAVGATVGMWLWHRSGKLL